MRLPNRLQNGFSLGWGHSFDWFPSHIHHQIAFCSLQSNSPKGKKRYSHKQEPSIGYRRGKPASITINHLPPRISLGLY
ncbi:BnaC04g12010D [Brassica napus]|uniref:BnaC04g12010D protein n=1 Tax=Brassica napus TaxID=3708 RepID=A0A078FG11_BRANA|nr:BnaC04g12010D [Brassica napus]